LGIHLVVCVLLAGGAGYALDGWLDSAPWAMLVGGTLGFAAWLRLVWQAMKA
jgi:F0F1-type ATP synthase assembly protein I